MSSAARPQTFYVCSTHWDREWYQPFQHFRYQMVGVLDEVLNKMQRDPRFACFQTDGQSIIIEDYLEIRPENEALVRDMARTKRLRIGPWYTMPDENLVAGESLIRNLEMGIALARDYGGLSQAGFVCDIFGHVSQLPQIFRSFGIEMAFLWRGTSEDRHRGIFRWRSPDGSEVVTYRFGPDEGYCDYTAKVRRAFDPADQFNLDRAVERAKAVIAMQRERMGTRTVLMFDGCDHMPIEPQTSDLLDRLRAALPDTEILHAGLDEFAAAVVAERASISRVFTGELRDPGRLPDPCWLIPGVLSSRIRLKQANRACETALCLWAEPFSHLAACRTGLEYPHGFLRTAWRHLLQNHAHDSICGCSIDQVHKDMEYRFDQSRLIAERLTDAALHGLAARVNVSGVQDNAFAVVLFNPTQEAIDAPVDFSIWLPRDTTPTFQEFFGFEPKAAFRLCDAEGREVPYDYIAHSPQRRRPYRPAGKIPREEDFRVVDVCAPVKVPAFGWTTLVCKPVTGPTRHPAGRLVVGDRALENEHLRIEVNDNGSLRLDDKRNRQTYDRLLLVEERADIGDGWYHGLAVNDEIHTSTASPADVALVEDGAYKATLRIRNRLHVPERFCFDVMRRSEQKALLLIEHYVTLRAGSDHLETRTVIDNNVRDHRIRVLFDSGATTDVYYADSAFDVVQRSIALPADNYTYKEIAVETTPQANWTAVHDERRGLAVIAPGLPETAVRDIPARTLALTLLRGFQRTVFTDGEEGGQSLGRHEFVYRLVPLAGPLPRTTLAVLAQRTAAGIRTVHVRPRDQVEPGGRTLPQTLGLLTMRPGKAVVTSLRRRPKTDLLELRCFNPGDDPITEEMTFDDAPHAACLTDFTGRELEPLKVAAGQPLRISLRPRQIVTVTVEVARKP